MAWSWLWLGFFSKPTTPRNVLSENSNMSEPRSSEPSPDLPPPPTGIDSQAVEAEMIRTSEKQFPEVLDVNADGPVVSEAGATNETRVDSTISREVTEVENKAPAGVPPKSGSSERQLPRVESRSESSSVTVIEATMDDAAWEEVEREHAKATKAWNDDAAVRETLDSFELLLTNAQLPRLLVDQTRQSDPQQKVFAVDPTSEDREIWFLGDIHSDLLALEAALAYLKWRGKPVAIVLLGDLFDDGPLGAETVLRVMRLILKDPSAVTLIVGNHDEALGISADGGEFRATVSPCEFSEWLNAPSQQANPLARQLGKLTIDLVSRSPRALFFQDGLLAAHGGVPLRDVWESLRTVGDLNDSRCLQDFVWTRPHHRRKRTIPNRLKKGAGLGHEDFSGFCEHAERLFDFPVRWMIRGHDHIDTVERFASFDAYRNHPILTINTLCYRLYRENLGAYVHAPCIAKYVPGKLPEIHCLSVPEALVRRVYPEPTAGS